MRITKKTASVRHLSLPTKLDQPLKHRCSQNSRLAAKFSLPGAVARLSLLRFSTTRLRCWCRRVNKAICRASESHAAKIPRTFFPRSGDGCIGPATLAPALPLAGKGKTTADPGTKNNGQLGARRWPLHRTHLR